MSTDTRVRPRPPGRRLPIQVDADRMQLDVIRDTLHRAQAATWLRRADDWEWAAPRPDDYTGRATPEDLAERAHRCHAKAAACRAHAIVVSHPATEPLPSGLVEQLVTGATA